MIRLRTISLGHGEYALLDEADAVLLNVTRWSVRVHEGKRKSAIARAGSGDVYMHRVITCAPDGAEVDHINGDPLDNRRANLRLCDRARNGANLPTRRSGFKGVYLKGGLWAAEINPNRTKVRLGTFETEEEAALAYDNAARKLYGDFCRPNFPTSEEAERLDRPRERLPLAELSLPRADASPRNGHTGRRRWVEDFQHEAEARAIKATEHALRMGV